MEEKTLGLVILGIVALIAVIGLVMMFKEMSKTGAPITISPVKTSCPAGYFETSGSTAASLMQQGAADCREVDPFYCCKGR